MLAADAHDGIFFDADDVRISRIREDNRYGGLRIRTTADIGAARIAVNIDVGFGDTIEPATELLNYPVLLDMPAPRLGGYARETVVAEKFQAMVALGTTSSRMKDYYDLWILSQSFDFERSRLAGAISATFARRKTPIPEEIPDALTPGFAELTVKQQQWESFKRSSETSRSTPGSLRDVLGALEAFLMPAAAAAREGE